MGRRWDKIKSLFQSDKPEPYGFVLNNQGGGRINFPRAFTKELDEIAHKNKMPWLYRQTRYGVPRDFDPVELRRLAASEIVQLCEGFIMEEIANTPWYLVERDAKTKALLEMNPRERPAGALRKKAMGDRNNGNAKQALRDAYQLIDNPNTSNHPFNALISMVLADMLEVGDGCMALSFREADLMDDPTGYSSTGIPIPDRPPAEIDCYDNLQYSKDLDDYGVLKGFWHFPRTTQGTGFGAPIILTTPELVWMTADPRSNRYYGYSKTEKAHSRIDLLILTIMQEGDIFTEGAISQGILSMEDWTPAQLKAFRKRFVEEVIGHPETMMYAEGKVTFIPFQFTYEQLQFLQRQLWYSKMVCGQFNLNLMVVGLQENASGGLNTSAWADKIVAHEKGIAPLLRKIEYFLNTQLFWPYFGEEIEFAFDPVMTLDDRQKLSTILVGEVAGGILTPDEAREEQGREPKDSDELVPVGGQPMEEDPFGGGMGGGSDYEFDFDSLFMNGKILKAKARRYISDRSEAPEGANVQQGSGGGLYYETTGSTPGADEEGGEEQPSKPQATPEARAEAFDQMVDHFGGEDEAVAHLQDIGASEDDIGEVTGETPTDDEQKSTGPGGHTPDGSGPYGRGDGPGAGAADGSGLDDDDDDDDDEKEDRGRGRIGQDVNEPPVGTSTTFPEEAVTITGRSITGQKKTKQSE